VKLLVLKPARGALVPLAILCTLAPAGLGIYQWIDSERVRPAATIGDLDDDYQGFVWSNKLAELQTTPVSLAINSRNRTRFTGTYTLAGQDVPVTGNVSAAGRLTAAGGVNQGGIDLRATATGQLSAGGEALVGTYSVTGRVETTRFSDRGSLVLTDEALP